MSERQLQDTGVLPGPKLKYHHCSSATEEEENKNKNKKIKNKNPTTKKATYKYRESKTSSWGGPTGQGDRNRIGDSPTGKGTHFKQAFALSSVSRMVLDCWKSGRCSQ